VDSNEENDRGHDSPKGLSRFFVIFPDNCGHGLPCVVLEVFAVKIENHNSFDHLRDLSRGSFFVDQMFCLKFQLWVFLFGGCIQSS